MISWHDYSHYLLKGYSMKSVEDKGGASAFPPSEHTMASMSAEQESVEVAQKAKKSARRSTTQYKAVSENMVMLTRNIEATTGAEETLNNEFRSAGWQDPNVSSNTCGIIKKALNKIENDANQYWVFYRMLEDITGLDIPLPSLSGESALITV